LHLILYTKPGCHLCEGLQEKLAQVRALPLELEVRDITTCQRWWEAYQYEVPVLCRQRDGCEAPLPRPSPRASVRHLEAWMQRLQQPQD